MNKATLPPSEYSEDFDQKRKNRVAVSYHKYGSAKKNFGKKLVDALATANQCIAKYTASHNTEYLVDAANYLMFEFMYPKYGDAYFEATDSNQSAGIVGMSIKEIEEFKNKY